MDQGITIRQVLISLIFQVQALLIEYFQCGILLPVSIHAVYNSTLLTSFVNNWEISQSRKRYSPDKFFYQGKITRKRERGCETAMKS